MNPNIGEIAAVDGREFAERVTTTSGVGRLHQHGPTLDTSGGSTIHDLWDGDHLRVQEKDVAELPARRVKRLLLAMFLGMDDGFAGQYPRGRPRLRASPSFLLDIWSLVFWIPVYGSWRWGICGSMEPVPILILTLCSAHVKKNPDGGLSRMLRAPCPCRGIGSFVLMPLALTFTEVLFKPGSPGISCLRVVLVPALLLFGYICMSTKKRLQVHREQ